MADANTTTTGCPDCGTEYGAADNYCRNCGMFLAIARELALAPATTRALERPRASLPAPVKRAATAVAVGTALHIGAGLAGKYVLRQAASAMMPSLKPRKPARQETRALASVEEPQRPRGTEITEALYVRRIWINRD